MEKDKTEMGAIPTVTAKKGAEFPFLKLFKLFLVLSVLCVLLFVSFIAYANLAAARAGKGYLFDDVNAVPKLKALSLIHI